MKQNLLLGKWKFTEVDDWEEDELNSHDPAILDIRARGEGSFSFLTISAEIDWKMDNPNDGARIDFSFMGDDDGTEVFGRGWAEFDGGDVDGKILFFQSNTHSFHAEEADDEDS